MKTEPTEEQLEKLVERLKANNPDWELQQEYGRMLMRHIDSFTPDERKRYDELTEILTKRSPLKKQ